MGYNAQSSLHKGFRVLNPSKLGFTKHPPTAEIKRTKFEYLPTAEIECTKIELQRRVSGAGACQSVLGGPQGPPSGGRPNSALPVAV